jgi:hypothetical protein
MSRPDRTALAASLAVCMACLVFIANPPSPRYYPLERVWRMENLPGEPSMGWYGRSAWTVAGGLLAGAVALVALRRVRRTPPGALLHACAGLALLLLTVAVASVVHHERHRLWGG